jgi:hypothetical protein
MFYVLDKNNNPKPVSADRWAFSFENGRRIVAQETVGGIWVSTVFLGLDHSLRRQRFNHLSALSDVG